MAHLKIDKSSLPNTSKVMVLDLKDGAGKKKKEINTSVLISTELTNVLFDWAAVLRDKKKNPDVSEKRVTRIYGLEK